MARLRTALFCALALMGCSSGQIAGRDAGSDGDVEDAARDGDRRPIDPCDAIVCPEGQSCADGRCTVVERCADVSCGNPGEVCDPRDGACHPGAIDDDDDGHTIADGDCDDSDPTIHPDASERCDGVDQDCDRAVDEGFPDDDDDGFDLCGFGDDRQVDCDDASSDVHPGAVEECDDIDNDCDGACDDGCRIGVHRAFHPEHRDHLYTTDAEYASSNGYELRVEDYFYILAEPTPGSVVLNLCFIDNWNDHVLIPGRDCGENQTHLAILGWIRPSRGCDAVPLYRIFDEDGTNHFFTLRETERDDAVEAGWLLEGIPGYVWTEP